MIGIYKITSPTNRIYIGQSIDIDIRFLYYKKLKCKNQPLLYRSLLKYGFENHKFEIIEECSIEQLNERERYWQDYYNVLEEGLNCMLTQTNTKSGEISQITKDKISSGNKGIIRSDEFKSNISNILKNHYKDKTHHFKGIKRELFNNKLTEKDVIKIRELLIQGKRTKEIALLFGVSHNTIQQIKQGKTWSRLGELKIKGKASRLNIEDLNVLYKLFELKVKVKDIQKVLPYCIATIAKQRKIWKQMKENKD